MIYLLYLVHILVCVFLILVVLLQQGRGADLSMFAGGSTQTAFGARGATTLLHKLTVASFLIFILTTLAIGIPQFAGNSTVMRNARTKSPAGKAAPAAAPGKPSPAKPGATAPVQGKPAAPAAAPAQPVATPPAQGKPAGPAAPGKPAVPAPAPPVKPPPAL